jgi:beta-N-acetylhexosaminidase
MNRKAIIFGVKGYKLTKKEKNLFKRAKPWGIILFSRNIKSISQLKNLIQSIKKNLNVKKYPILIDQEGGKVSRLDRIIDFRTFSNDFFGKLYKKNKKLLLTYLKIYIDTVSDIFNDVGININTVPVLDVRRKNAHSIIGSRSFSSNPKIVSKLGKIYVNMYEKNKIATVNKHIPGHGLSKSDSHKNTPKIVANKKELVKKDFYPFYKCKSQFAMTGHVIYSSFDEFNTATHSKKVIKEIIRNKINFNGLLISDDITMKSLKYKIEDNALKALNAGCNIVLHCNGNIVEMNKLNKVIPKIDKFTQQKTSQFYKFLG